MNVFDSLLRLYRTNMSKTPLEDFTTEILVYILNTNQILKYSFISDFLQIKGSNFTITSQETYLFGQEEGRYCKIDIVIKNENSICFLENKVHSKEGSGQLEMYSKLLDSLNTYEYTYLKYCTKFYDNKIITGHNFQQYRWFDVANFLRKWQYEEMINEFLNFLESNNMGNSTQFTIQDVLAMENLNPLLIKMDSYLDKIKPQFSRIFDGFKNLNNMNQIKTHSRYVFYKDNVIGDNYSELGVGFEWKTVPRLLVWIWLDDKNSNLKQFRNMSVNTSDFYHDGRNYLESSKQLSDFLSSENMELSIEEWFNDTFKSFRALMISQPELGWNMNFTLETT